MLSFTSPAALFLCHNDFSLPSHQLLPTWLWPSDREALTGISLQSVPCQGGESTEHAPNIHSCILNGLPLLLAADPTGGLLPTTEVVRGADEHTSDIPGSQSLAGPSSVTVKKTQKIHRRETSSTWRVESERGDRVEVA